jgi:hypothetical protein
MFRRGQPYKLTSFVTKGVSMRLLLPIVLAAVLGACATRPDMPFLPEADWKAGARSANIQAIETPATPMVEPAGCAAAFERAHAAGLPIVSVSYQSHHSRHHMFAVAEAVTPLATGKWVELWPADCTTGQLARVVPIPGAPRS